jgi:DNA-binding IclR family transcriptional regulator
LELLAQSKGGLRLTDVAALLELPKSSTSLLLTAITDLGWAERRADGVYLIGLRAWEVGQEYLLAKTLVERAQPVMDSVRDSLNETVRLSILDGRENVYIGQSAGGQALAMDTPIGARLPAHATGLGKVLLSALDEQELRRRFQGVQFVPYTEHTVGSIDQLLSELAAIRLRGWGEDHQEYVLGVHCVAAPVRDHTGAVVAAISVSVPAIRFSREHRKAALDALLDASAALSARLGAPAGLSTRFGPSASKTTL